MKKAIDLPNLTLGFDVTSAWNRIQDPEDYIYLFGKELAYLGICDFGGKVPGSGTADFLCWKRALDKVGFQGTVTVKLSSEQSVCADSVARKSLEYLKDWEDM